MLVAFFSSASLFLAAITGTSMFAWFGKAGGDSIVVNRSESTVMFWLTVFVNLFVAVFCWALFIGWLRERSIKRPRIEGRSI